MSQTKELHPLTDVLEQLEHHLELPYISGDLHHWAETALKLLQEAEGKLQHAIEQEHPRHFDTMVKNHSNLRGEADKLREEDRQLLPALRPVGQQAEQFVAGIDETALAGQQFQARRERLVSDGLSLILRIRRQQAAIDAWLGEALTAITALGTEVSQWTPERSLVRPLRERSRWSIPTRVVGRFTLSG